MNFNVTGYLVVECKNVSWDRDQGRVYEKTLMKFGYPQNAGNFLTRRQTIIFLIRTMSLETICLLDNINSSSNIVLHNVT
jgi:hypothetical protein